MSDTYDCFLAVPDRLDVSPIVDLLRAHAVEFKPGFEASSFLGNHPREIKRLIRRADFVFAIIESEQDSSHVLIEVGIALAIGKPIFAVVTPTSTIPFGLPGISMVKAELRDVQPISFHLEIFLKEALKRKPQQRNLNLRDTLAIRDTYALTLDKQSTDEGYLQLLHLLTNEVQLEKAISYFLQDKGFHVEEGVKAGGFRPDLALWLQEPSSSLGNQLLIEIKKGLRSKNEEERIAGQLRKYLAGVGAQVAVLLWQTGAEKDELKTHPGFPLVFSFSVPLFVKLVENRQLIPTLVRERNRHVHGIR